MVNYSFRIMQIKNMARLADRFYKRHLRDKIKAAFIFLFIYAPVYLFGSLADKFVQDSVGKSWQKSLSIQNLGPYLPYIPLLILFLIGQYWRSRENSFNFFVDRLYSDLEDFYQELNLGRNKNAEARCVIWLAAGEKEGIPTRMRQLTAYCPDSLLMARAAGPGSNVYKENPIPPRNFTISKRENELILPIGVLGKFVHECIRSKDDSGKILSIPPPEDCVNYAVNQLNFTPQRAARLTPERRCFMFIPIMTSDKSRLIAVVLCDSLNHDYFKDYTVKKAQKFLPRLAKSLLR